MIRLKNMKTGDLMEELHKKWEKIHHCLQALEQSGTRGNTQKKLMSVCCLSGIPLNDEMENFLTS